jgi:hypothetical protein
MSQGYESIGTVALMYLAQWTGLEPSRGEIQFDNFSVSSSTSVNISKSGIDGTLYPVFATVSDGDSLVIASESDHSRWIRVVLGVVTQTSGFISATIASVPESSSFAYGERAVLTRIPSGTSGAITAIPWDDVLTDGATVLVGGGNILTL